MHVNIEYPIDDSEQLEPLPEFWRNFMERMMAEDEARSTAFLNARLRAIENRL